MLWFLLYVNGGNPEERVAFWGEKQGRIGFVKVSGLSFVKESGQEPFNPQPNPRKEIGAAGRGKKLRNYHHSCLDGIKPNNSTIRERTINN